MINQFYTSLGQKASFYHWMTPKGYKASKDANCLQVFSPSYLFTRDCRFDPSRAASVHSVIEKELLDNEAVFCETDNMLVGLAVVVSGDTGPTGGFAGEAGYAVVVGILPLGA